MSHLSDVTIVVKLTELCDRAPKQVEVLSTNLGTTLHSIIGTSKRKSIKHPIKSTQFPPGILISFTPCPYHLTALIAIEHGLIALL
jgi:hypothetical protein